ncbi:hypothetical protein ABW21_db0207497 [Orbilia brochopaga]|nr:hypothetical protein ABW21_db0207497 [Drechslerella brochopaga]
MAHQEPSGSKPGTMDLSIDEFIDSLHIPGAFPPDEPKVRKPKKGRSRAQRNAAKKSSKTGSSDSSSISPDTSGSSLSPPSSPMNASETKEVGQTEGSIWYDPEVWPQEKVIEQEARAAKLIGNFESIKATLEYYCAHDLQHHTKWVRILADHILLLAQSKSQDLNHAVAIEMSQRMASGYRQHLEASLLTSESKRKDVDTSAAAIASLRGKRKIRRTDAASWSKGTHPLMISRAMGIRSTIPKLIPIDNDEGNFKLIGPDDFIMALQIPQANREAHLDEFRRLRDDIYKSLRDPSVPYDKLFFLRNAEAQEAETEAETEAEASMAGPSNMIAPIAGPSTMTAPIAGPSMFAPSASVAGPSAAPIFQPAEEVFEQPQVSEDIMMAPEFEMELEDAEVDQLSENINDTGGCAIQ